MARADRDPLPPVEIWDPEPAREPTTHVQEISVGSARGGRRLWIALAVVVVGLVVAGVAVDGGAGTEEDPDQAASEAEADDDPDDEREAQSPRSTTTTEAESSVTDPTRPERSPATPGVPPVLQGTGPPFGRPVGASLVFLVGNRAYWYDLDTGDHAEIEDWEAGGPIVPVQGGVVVDPGFGAEYVSLPGGERERIGPFEPIPVSAGRSDAVWLVSSPSAGSSTAQLIDLSGTVLVRAFDVPVYHWEIVGTPAGLIAEAGGQLYLLAPTGPRPLGPGELLSATGQWAVIRLCDERLACRVEAVDVVSGERRGFGAIDSRESWFEHVWISPDGRYLARSVEPGAPGLVVIREDGTPLDMARQAILQGEVHWLPDSSGLIVGDRISELLLLTLADGSVEPATQSFGLWDWMVLIPDAR